MTEKALRPKMGIRIPRYVLDQLDAEAVVIPDHILVGIPVDFRMMAKVQELMKNPEFAQQFEVWVSPKM